MLSGARKGGMGKIDGWQWCFAARARGYLNAYQLISVGERHANEGLTYRVHR